MKHVAGVTGRIKTSQSETVLFISFLLLHARGSSNDNVVRVHANLAHEQALPKAPIVQHLNPRHPILSGVSVPGEILPPSKPGPTVSLWPHEGTYEQLSELPLLPAITATLKKYERWSL